MGESASTVPAVLAELGKQLELDLQLEFEVRLKVPVTEGMGK